MHGAVAVDVRDGLALVRHDFHAHLERQILAAPVLLSCGNKVITLGKIGIGACGARGIVTVNQYTVVVQHGHDRRQKRICHGAIDQQRLGGIAHAYALGLGINDNVERLIKVGGLMHVDVAVARARLDHRHKRLAHAALDQPAPPRGMSTSTMPRSFMSSPVASRSVDSIIDTASRGKPLASSASASSSAIMAHE